MIENPVLRKELITRYRNRANRGTMFVVWLLAGILIFGIHYLVISFLINTHDPSAADGALKAVICVEYLLICLLAPSAAANAITQEKEQQTWEMLVFTLLTPAQIIVGKLTARLAPLVGILVAFLPLSAYCYISSAGAAAPFTMSPVSLCLCYAVMLVSAFAFTTFGLAASWWSKRTLYAIMASYTLVIGGLCIGTALIAAAAADMSGGGAEDKLPLFWMNPVMMMSNAMEDTGHRGAGYWHVIVALIAYLALAGVLLGAMTLWFRRNTE